MNSWLILLLLLFADGNCSGGNGDSDCGCERNGFGQTGYRSGGNDLNGGFGRGFGSGRNRDNDGDCGCERTRGNDDDCGCGGNESRFESRFDAKPFGNTDCGCDNQ